MDPNVEFFQALIGINDYPRFSAEDAAFTGMVMQAKQLTLAPRFEWGRPVEFSALGNGSSDAASDYVPHSGSLALVTPALGLMLLHQPRGAVRQVRDLLLQDGRWRVVPLAYVDKHGSSKDVLDACTSPVLQHASGDLHEYLDAGSPAVASQATHWAQRELDKLYADKSDKNHIGQFLDVVSACWTLERAESLGVRKLVFHDQSQGSEPLLIRFLRFCQGDDDYEYGQGQKLQHQLERYVRLGADVHVTDSEGATALHHAAARNMDWAVRFLLGCGVDPCKRDGLGREPTDLATDGEVRGFLRAAAARSTARSIIQDMQDKVGPAC